MKGETHEAYDILIKNGRIVDLFQGSRINSADVKQRTARSAETGTIGSGDACVGRRRWPVVALGFIDNHHYDVQVIWDPLCSYLVIMARGSASSCRRSRWSRL